MNVLAIYTGNQQAINFFITIHIYIIIKHYLFTAKFWTVKIKFVFSNQVLGRIQSCLLELITLVNKDFGPCGKMSLSDVFLGAEFEYVFRISLSPSPFALHQTM